uniref:Spire-type actin nucleation factor 2 n=1 Tax=Tetraodon nigroviridis TaxID=99883 RepID=H3CTW2_TETNG
EPRELSLEEVLKSYEQPINEEQAWAVCFQCCERAPEGRRTAGPRPDQLCDASVVSSEDEALFPPAVEHQLVQSLGVAIYRALDWGLDDSEERDLGPQLEQLIERMVGGDQGGEDGSPAGNSAADEGYSGRAAKPVRAFRQVMALCACRLADPSLAPEHYQAVCRALFVETLELQTFLVRIRDAKEMLKKIASEESLRDNSTAELDALKHRDWARLWVQLMKELRQGVKLKKVQEQPFNTLPTEFSLTPFEMLMQDIRARNFQLRKVMVGGDIPTRVKRNAHELILDFIRSRPPLKPVSERSLPPPPPQQQSLHERVLAEIKQERKLRPVVRPSSRPFGSLPCLAETCPCDVKSTSCIDLSVCRPLSRPRVLLKAPTLAEMEEMNLFEEEDSPDRGELRRAESSPTPLKRDRSFSEHDLALLRGGASPSLAESLQQDGPVRLRDERPRSRTLAGPRPVPGHRASFPSHGRAPASPARLSLTSVDETTETKSGSSVGDEHQWMEFSHPVESLALTVDEVINVRRVLVKAEMEKFLQKKELYSNLKKGKLLLLKPKSPLFSWPSTCLLCKRSVCASCSAKMKIPSKKMAHIPVYTVGFHSTPRSHEQKFQVYKRFDRFPPSPSPRRPLHNLSRRSVEEEFPHLYAHGCLRGLCAECTKFLADVISSSRRSLDVLNNTPKREARAAVTERPRPQHRPHL